MKAFLVLVRFHRFIVAVLAGALVFWSSHRAGLALLVLLCAWLAQFLVRQAFNRIAERRNFRTHTEPFRRMFGPYGQKITRAAQGNRVIRRKLNEVFSPRRAQVEEAVKQLQFMNELARLGMRSTGDAAEAEELALAYGKSRLERNDFTAASSARMPFIRRKAR